MIKNGKLRHKTRNLRDKNRSKLSESGATPNQCNSSKMIPLTQSNRKKRSNSDKWKPKTSWSEERIVKKATQDGSRTKAKAKHST
tara:strand:- start:77 stop:331 length:255 start_codon:yes stop_codon:yes gene_type:complete